MQVIELNDVYILVSEIQKDTDSRRTNERLAISALLAEAVPGAKLGHHLNGAPYIHNHENLNVSVSHSQSNAALAISEKNVIGIDIEAPREQLKRVSKRFLSPVELEEFSKLPDGLLRAWTAKEAVYKCAGFDDVEFATEICITATGTATLRNKAFTLHWHSLSSGQLLCLAL
jgi:phosphopantetheinyl transferase